MFRLSVWNKIANNEHNFINWSESNQIKSFSVETVEISVCVCFDFVVVVAVYSSLSFNSSYRYLILFLLLFFRVFIHIIFLWLDLICRFFRFACSRMLYLNPFLNTYTDTMFVHGNNSLNNKHRRYFYDHCCVWQLQCDIDRMCVE